MQNILYFNTIFQYVELILQLKDGKIIEKRIENSKQSEILVYSIKTMLQENNLEYSDIDVFTSITGPGNFTGIKTSLAVLKALSITTNAKIITCSVFDILSFNLNYDMIILAMNGIKCYIKENDEYYTIYKKDLNNFLLDNQVKKILTNIKEVAGKNIVFSDFSNKKWVDLVNYKAKNNEFTQDIEALYIEEAGITKRKNKIT